MERATTLKAAIPVTEQENAHAEARATLRLSVDQERHTLIDAEIEEVATELAAALKAAPLQPKSELDSASLVMTAKLGALEVSRGVVKFGKYAKAVIDQMRGLGVNPEEIKPLLKASYAATSMHVDADTFELMDDVRSVREFDLGELDSAVAEGAAANPAQKSSAKSVGKVESVALPTGHEFDVGHAESERKMEKPINNPTSS